MMSSTTSQASRGKFVAYLLANGWEPLATNTSYYVKPFTVQHIGLDGVPTSSIVPLTVRFASYNAAGYPTTVFVQPKVRMTTMTGPASRYSMKIRGWGRIVVNLDVIAQGLACHVLAFDLEAAKYEQAAKILLNPPLTE